MEAKGREDRQRCCPQFQDLPTEGGHRPGLPQPRTAQMATKVALDAIQILGGYGYTREFPVERAMRDAKLIEIGAGTNEVMRLIIARQMLGEVASL